MRFFAALALLLALASAARAADAPEPEDCDAGLQRYTAAPTAPLMRELMPCLEDPDPRVRAKAFDKLARREVWDDPLFKNELRPKLRALTARAQRDPHWEVSKFAGSMSWWLENSQTWDRQKAAAAQAAAKAYAEQADASWPTSRLRLSCIFGAGVALQTIILVARGGGDVSGLVWPALLALFAFLPGKHERHYELHFHAVLYFLAFACCAFARFKDEVLSHVSESSLLVNSLTFWFLSCTFLGWLGVEKVALVAAVPTLLTLTVAFTLRQWSFPMKLACYVWFLLLAAANSAFQIGYGSLSFLFIESYRSPGAWDLFLTGMAATLLASHLFFVWILIPLQGKNETREHRMKQWREDADRMVSRFADYQLTPLAALRITVLQLGFYAVNHWTRWLVPATMMNVSIVLLPLASEGLLALAAQAEGPAPAPAAPPRARVKDAA